MGGDSPPESHTPAEHQQGGRLPQHGISPWEDMANRGSFPAPEADMTNQAGLLLPLGLALAPALLCS